MKIEKDCINYKMKISKYKGQNIKTYITTLFTYKDICNKLIKTTDGAELKAKKLNTINYITTNYEAGAIYIEIKDNKIADLYALVNLEFKNKWHSYLPKDFNSYSYNKEKERVLKTRVFEPAAKLKSPEYWTKNGFLINMFNYGTIFNSYQLELIDLIKETLNKKKIKNICFIIWTKDVPLLNYTGKDIYIPQYKINIQGKQFLPILSQSTLKGFLDIPIPNSEEWQICRKLYFPPPKYDKKNKTFKCSYFNTNLIQKYEWKDKIEKGFFRGSSTGYYNDLRNPRLLAAHLGTQYPELLDTGITTFVKRDKIIDGEISYFIPNNFGLTAAPFVNNLEFGKYKYIINIEGNGLPYRKPSLFFYSSVILDVQSNFKSWFEIDELLKPYVHYIPIKSDLSDLVEKIEWCKNNDEECKKIAMNCYNFALTHFNYDFYLNYMKEVLNGS
jgi:hypothetical protein